MSTMYVSETLAEMIRVVAGTIERLFGWNQ